MNHVNGWHQRYQRLDNKRKKIEELFPRKRLDEELPVCKIPTISFSYSLSRLLQAQQVTESRRIANSIFQNIVADAWKQINKKIGMNLFKNFIQNHSQFPLYTSVNLSI